MRRAEMYVLGALLVNVIGFSYIGVFYILQMTGQLNFINVVVSEEVEETIPAAKGIKK